MLEPARRSSAHHAPPPRGPGGGGSPGPAPNRYVPVSFSKRIVRRRRRSSGKNRGKPSLSDEDDDPDDAFPYWGQHVHMQVAAASRPSLHVAFCHSKKNGSSASSASSVTKETVGLAAVRYDRPGSSGIVRKARIEGQTRLARGMQEQDGPTAPPLTR